MTIVIRPSMPAASTCTSSDSIGFWSAARERQTFVRALKVAVLVGTILTCINQGDFLLSGNFEAIKIWKILMTYCVPFCVSTYSSAAYAVEAAKQKARRATDAVSEDTDG